MQAVAQSPRTVPIPVPMPLDAGCTQVRAWLQQGQAAQAWALLRQLNQVHPQQVVVPRLQGALLSATGQHVQALACYRAALALAPHDGQTLTAAGGCLHLLGDLPPAVQHYRAAPRCRRSAARRCAWPSRRHPRPLTAPPPSCCITAGSAPQPRKAWSTP